MGDLSPNFSRWEFACKCGCGFDTVDVELLLILQKIRDHFEQPVSIESGCRCESHNQAEGGSPNSQHLVGRAADIKVRGIPANLVQELCEDLGVSGLGKYTFFTHIDTRTGGPARW